MNSSKKIVVYFSYTGHTKMIAEKISKELNCDILELKPIVPYSDNYQEVVDDEQNSEVSNHIPEIEKVNIDLNKYDEIILGFPTWWYRPAPVVRAFLKNNDLTGKNIVPFATNAGWLGRSFTEVKKLCPKSIVKNEMNIVFESYSDNLQTEMSEVENWIKSL